MRRRTVLVLALTAASAVVLARPTPAAPGAPGRAPWPVDDPSCAPLEVVIVDGIGSCTHGPDPAPPGVDASVPRPIESSRPMDASAETPTVPLPCYGDGTSGNRVQAIYARPADRADRAAQVVPAIRRWAGDVEAAVSVSASRTGGIRHVRWVTAADCTLSVEQLTLSSTGDDSIGNTIAELAAQGHARPDRKYLVWMDSTVLCGIANFFLDDRPEQTNANNGVPQARGSVARVDSGCWGLGSRGQSVEAHELIHTLGAVMPSAPNSTSLGHCTDDSDRMCYEDGSPLIRVRTVCPSADEALLDCGNDDYFHTAPPSGSYLASHWNTADSSFLAAADPPPAPSDIVTRLSGSDRIATSVVASSNAFPGSTSARAAVLANAASFADALPGVPLAAAKGGPLLLTGREHLDDRVRSELQRVLPRGASVYLLGGTGALTDAVAVAVQQSGFEPVRLGGADRFETAVQIAERGLAAPATVFEATGQSFPDALAGGAAAAASGGAILLTDGTSQSRATAAYLLRHPTTTRYALGGPAATADPTATAIAGQDRFETAVLVARRFFGAVNTVGVASGYSFPDALAGGANIANRNGPMLLAASAAPLPQALTAYLSEVEGLSSLLLYGGRQALGDDVVVAVNRAVGW